GVRVTCRRATVGSPTNLRGKTRTLKTPAGAAPGLSSSARKSRPTSGLIPRVEKNSAETSRPDRRSGSPAPVKLKLSFPRTADIEEQTVFCARQSTKLGYDGQEPVPPPTRSTPITSPSPP